LFWTFMIRSPCVRGFIVIGEPGPRFLDAAEQPVELFHPVYHGFDRRFVFLRYNAGYAILEPPLACADEGAGLLREFNPDHPLVAGIRVRDSKPAFSSFLQRIEALAPARPRDSAAPPTV
jgi:hypothetical protein